MTQLLTPAPLAAVPAALTGYVDKPGSARAFRMHRSEAEHAAKVAEVYAGIWTELDWQRYGYEECIRDARAYTVVGNSHGAAAKLRAAAGYRQNIAALKAGMGDPEMAGPGDLVATGKGTAFVHRVDGNDLVCTTRGGVEVRVHRPLAVLVG